MLWYKQAAFGKKCRADAVEVPPKGGIYIFRRVVDKAPVYVGESCNLRKRLLRRYQNKDSTLSRAIRVHRSLFDAPLQKIREVILSEYEFDYKVIPFGRLEMEEFLQKKLHTNSHTELEDVLKLGV